jgi:glycosyltransferase involved in cell wall biosynthesis
MTKVLIIRSRYTDPAIRKVAESLSHAGYEVTLLIWDRNGKRTLSEEKTEYKIDYFQLQAPQDTPLAVLFLPFWWVYEFLYLFKLKPDIIHACDLDTQYPAIIAKIVNNKSLVYMIYDFYANNLPSGSFKVIRKCLQFLIAFIEKRGIYFSDLLILVDESRIDEVQGARIKNLVYIYNSPQKCIFEENEKKFENSNLFTIFYGGRLTKGRGIEHMIQAVSGLDGVQLYLGGELIDKDILRGCDNLKIRYIGWIPTYSELMEYTSDSDILFRFSDPNHPKTKYESPNKLFEAMLCGKAIIVSDNSSMANIVRKENCGIVIEYGNVEDIKKAIISLKSNPDLRQTFSKNARSAYEQRYSWSIMEKRLIESYKKI